MFAAFEENEIVKEIIIYNFVNAFTTCSGDHQNPYSFHGQGSGHSLWSSEYLTLHMDLKEMVYVFIKAYLNIVKDCNYYLSQLI